MDTGVRTPQEIFNLPQYLVVPIFQRPYVWEEEHQWTPLWQDVRRITELRLTPQGAGATHFLGAVVLQAQPPGVNSLTARDLIDGQQRLTTIQLLMDAAALVLEELEQDNQAPRLADLTHNPTHFVASGQSTLKVRHTNRDREAFDEVMNVEPLGYNELTHTDSRIARAHKYFSSEVRSWLGEADLPAFTGRSAALASVLTQGLQLVTIDLRYDENSQEIFETLNARGTPLTAADLIKNFVFQRLSAEGEDTARAYKEDRLFDKTFWEQEVSVGRYLLSRSSLFLGQWLISRTGEEIGPRVVFNRFKHYVEHESQTSMSALLKEVKAQADLYKAWTERAASTNDDLDPVLMCVYRMRAMDLETLKPILIWLHERPRPADAVLGVVASTESWLVRRALLRLKVGDLGRVVADLILVHRNIDDADLANLVAAYLTNLDVESTYWPGDDEVRKFLLADPAYRRYRRPRLRMFLEAVEDHLRGYTTKPMTLGRVPRKGFHIEHVLPRSWQQHWPTDDAAAELERREHVHRIGNLTLLNGSLNASVSNGPWAGPNGKQQKLQDHDVFLMNRRIKDVEQWDERAVDARTALVADALLATWPVPDGHVGRIAQLQQDSGASQIYLPQLITLGLLAVGTELHPRTGGVERAVVLADGRLEMNGQTYDSPSGAAHVVGGGSRNGWQFWALPDGRRLGKLREEAVAAEANRVGRSVDLA